MHPYSYRMVSDAWREPFRRFSAYLSDSSDLVNITYRGAHGTVALIGIRGVLDEFKSGSIEGREGDADLKAKAEREIQSDFPMLHGHAIVGEWGALECLIEDLAEAWLSFNPKVLEDPTLARVQVPLADFMAMTEAQRFKFLIAGIQRDLKLDLKSGATKFEKLLDAIGLGGAVDPRIRAALHETQSLRNVLAHRGGIADERFVRACPGLGFEEGRRIAIGRDLYNKLHTGMSLYAMVLFNRCMMLIGQQPVASVGEDEEWAGALAFSLPSHKSSEALAVEAAE